MSENKNERGRESGTFVPFCSFLLMCYSVLVVFINASYFAEGDKKKETEDWILCCCLCEEKERNGKKNKKNSLILTNPLSACSGCCS